MQIVENRHYSPVEVEFKSERAKVRRIVLDNGTGIDQIILEKEVIGILPEQFMKTHIDCRNSNKSNRRTAKLEVLSHEFIESTGQ